ncbi:putative protein family, YAP/Alf4/glomulin [Niveomyces insectorum RCEF 264]|uniref:Yap-binding protein-like protein n=1 Tax=Niveomyces insectorum RCEF 264 TaxID=1081102 RepID=A0A162MED3_9HYPO|nr:putative protein family, YAP/Alf4/glomulin [Niveomyces insectorum RCEF 264]
MAASTQATATATTAAAALFEARPPATDRFTYLTLVEQHLSPDVLPTLHDVLQDAQLTQEIGWDLVEMLVPLLPASEDCLDDVARLGNPREVILKVLEVLESLKTRGRRRQNGRYGGRYGEEREGEEEQEKKDDEDGTDDDDDYEEEDEEEKEEHEGRHGHSGEDDSGSGVETTTRIFVVLLGMLGVLHRRIKTKYPSRFLESTLRTILAVYRPDRPAMTTAVLGLMRSLAGRHRPPPPMRRSDSSVVLAKKTAASNTSDTVGRDDGPAFLAQLARSNSAINNVALDHGRPDDAAVGVPDPEAEDSVEPSEHAVQQQLLQSFLTCVLEAYVNANELAWAPRLIEHYHPDKVVPGRPTLLQDYREDPDKITRDAAVGQLVALALDLGLTCSDALVQSVCRGPVRRNPLADPNVASGGINSIPLSTGGVLCLLAYWVFSSDVFKADAPVPRLHVFPEHYAMLEAFFDDNAAAQIARTPGTVEAIVVVGLWLDHHGLYSAGATPDTAASMPADDFMPYHHLLTLCAVFHPVLAVRNAATALAGAVLHANPDAEDRLKILQDLLENCMFASLRACAVTWLREEILLAAAADIPTGSGSGSGSEATSSASAAAGGSSPFAGTEAVEQLQYAIFPDLQALVNAAPASSDEDEVRAMLDYWQQNAPFLLQAANFAYFLFRSERYRSTIVPPGMGPAIEQRYVEPLLQAATRLRSVLDDGSGSGSGSKRAAGGDGGEAGHEPLHMVLDLDVLTNRLGNLKLT